jgi:hypothetical protein
MLSGTGSKAFAMLKPSVVSLSELGSLYDTSEERYEYCKVVFREDCPGVY